MANNTTKRITKKDNFNAIRAILRAANEAGIALEGNEQITYDTLDRCIENELMLLDKKMEVAQKRAMERKIEGDALRDKIYDVISAEEFMTIDEIQEALNDPDVSHAMITARLKQLYDLNKIEKKAIKVEPTVENGRPKRLTAYRLSEEV